ncbi:DNA primase [Haloplanus sp. C73]|uniref:DNA primase n=1 Tax=Haloplanus sp. C73 TaxID=3421641 RepID=UPI003EBBE582
MNARTGAVLMAVMLVASAVAPAAVAGQTGESLSLDVAQDDAGDVTITVTDNGTAVENATVNVTSDSYAGAGEYETDANGTVSLAAPNDSVTVTVEATYDNASTSTTTDLEPALDVSIAGADDGSVVVSVMRGDSAVENATVNVTANATYTDAGEYETDENGTVTLANPDQTVELTVTAMEGNDTATTSVVVRSVDTFGVGVDQTADGTVVVSVGRAGEPVTNATVTVESDTYAGAGEYTTDDSGTVTLPAPSENVTVDVTAMEGNDTATTTAELTPPEPTGPFGQVVSALAQSLKGAGFTGIGEQMSDFVTSNNPSNASDRSANASNPGVGNAENATPPGQQDNETGQPRVVPADPPVNDSGAENESDAPGNSGSAPGQADDGEDDAPGNSGSAPGQSGEESDDSDDAPGNSGSAPGQSGEESDESDDSEESDESEESEASDESDEADEADDSDGDDDSDDESSDGGNGGSDNAGGGNAGGGNAGGNGNGR